MMKNKREKKEIGKGIEETLIELRIRKEWTRMELVEKLNDNNITEKEIKKWEVGLKYPDLDTIYKLSEIYQVPSAELIQAKSNSYEKGMAGINMQTIKWICYILNVSLYTGTVITILIYIFGLVFAFAFFAAKAAPWY